MAKKKTKGKKKKISKKSSRKDKIPKDKKAEKKLEKTLKDSKKKEKHIYEKILRNFFIGIGIVILLILMITFMFKSISSFEYQGVDFKLIKEGDLLLYNTKIPVIYNGENAEYNFYLRNDPRKLGEEIEFEGNMLLTKNLVIKSDNDFQCDGDGVIAVANVVNLYRILGVNVIKDENATCSETGEYSYIDLKTSNTTMVEQIGPSCYNVHISDCEILKGTERLMLEIFIKFHEG